MRLSLLLASALTLAAQTPAFEVASLRSTGETIASASSPSSVCRGAKSETENLEVITSLRSMLEEAYTNQADRLDLPPPVTAPMYRLSVRVPPNTSKDTCRAMLRKLLAERLHLVTDVEFGEVPTYVLKVADSGLKLKPAQAPLPNSETGDVKSPGRWTFRSAPLERVRVAVSSLIEVLAAYRTLAKGEVKDETGLTGYYDGKLAFDVRIDLSGLGPSQETLLKDAVANQLGLTIEIRKATGTVLTIRSVDSVPTEN